MTRSTFCALSIDLFSQTEVAKRLESKKISISGNKIQPSTLNLIVSLIDEYQITEKFSIYFNDEVGPQKIKRHESADGPILSISTDAEERLFGVQLQKQRQQICTPNAPTGDVNLVISYANTAHEQLMRALLTLEQVQSHLKKRTGWKIRDLTNPVERDFRLEELISIEKQLIDLPENVLKVMKIKTIARQQYGVPLPKPNAAAIYFVKDEKILFGDGAFLGGSDIYGEGTIIHEMGHAYWHAKTSQFQEEFTAISWQKENSQYQLKGQSSKNFVSDYAMVSPEEDFAEHFSAYVHQPEWLKSQALEKFSFLKTKVFIDTEYFTTVSENAKINIDSEQPDTTPPWLNQDIAVAFSAGADFNENISATYPLKVMLTQARDDISGFDKILVALKHEQDLNTSIFVDLKPTGSDIKNTDLVGIVNIDPSKIPAGNYKPNQIALVDRANNTTFYKTDSIKSIYLKGLLGSSSRAKPNLDQNKIMLKPISPIDGYQGVELTLPIPHDKYIDSLHINWDVTSLDAPTVHVCNDHFKSNQSCFLSKPGDPEIKMRHFFWKEYSSGDIALTQILFNYLASETNGKDSFSYPITRKISFQHETGRNRPYLIDLNVNKMALLKTRGTNKLGGDTSIAVQVPILNENAGDYHVMVSIRAPSGKRLLHIANKNNSSIDGENLVFNFPLYANQEKGTYLIESFEVTTKFERPKNIPLLMDHGKPAVVKIKLIERGIHKSFTIKEDRTIQLN
jgi:hypothetical protein